jgi:hypothetical protein
MVGRVRVARSVFERVFDIKHFVRPLAWDAASEIEMYDAGVPVGCLVQADDGEMLARVHRALIDFLEEKYADAPIIDPGQATEAAIGEVRRLLAVESL